MGTLTRLNRYFFEILRSFDRFPTGPVAEVYVDPHNRSRRFLLLAHLLSGVGLNLRIHWDWSRFRNLNDKGYRAFESPRVRLAGLFRTKPSLLVWDEGQPPSKGSGVRSLVVRYEARECPDPLPPRTTFVPLLFHPSLMTPQSFESARIHSENQDRSLGVFFAGNLDPAVYDKPIFAAEYGLLNRHEVVQVLREPEFRDWLYEPASWQDFEDDRQAGRLRDKFTLIDVRRFSIPQNRWLELLGQTRYFLAPTGYTQPFCHNLIEALSVGAVPVTGYGHLLRPTLNDQNSLRFTDAESLRNRLRDLRAGRTGNWLSQSHAAREYQQMHLSPQSLEAVFRSFLTEAGTEPWNLVLSGSL